MLLAVAGVVVLGVRVSPFFFGAPAAVALLAAGGVWRRRRRVAAQHQAEPETRLPRSFRWVPLAWVGFTFISMQHFTKQALAGDSVSRGSGPSVENVLQLAFYGAVTLAILVQSKQLAPLPGPRLLFPLYAWPVFGVLSAAWSIIPLFSLVRALQLLVPVTFAIFTARILHTIDDDGRAFARPFIRLFCSLAALLALYAFVFPVHETATGAAGGTRLTWYGANTLSAAELWGMAALALVVVGPGVLRLSFAGWAARLALVCVAVALAQGRSIFLGLLVAIPLALWARWGRRQALSRYLAPLYYVSLCVIAVVLFHQQLFEAATRGEGTQRLLNLDGRLPLWSLAVRQLQTVPQLFGGFGFGSAGTKLSEDVAFAGNAHNSFIEALVGVGLIGMTLLVWWVVSVGLSLRASRTSRLHPAVRSFALAGFGLLLVLGLASPELALPGFGYSFCCLFLGLGLRSPVPNRLLANEPALPASPSPHPVVVRLLGQPA